MFLAVLAQEPAIIHRRRATAQIVRVQALARFGHTAGTKAVLAVAIVALASERK